MATDRSISTKHDLTLYEVNVLRRIADGDPLTVGAATHAALETLRNRGFITGYLGIAPQLTGQGVRALESQ